MAKKAKNGRPAAYQMPELWADHFRRSTMRTNFMLALSQAMIEFLCSVADDVKWDRSRYSALQRPDNWFASEDALTKRGLIRRKCRQEVDAYMEKLRLAHGADATRAAEQWHFCELTPAGEAVVQLLKVTGIFVEADAAIEKRNRKA